MPEPRIENFEGIPFPLKEASLDEYVGALEPNHLARRELNELRKLALDGAKATAELLEALKKNRELEAQIKVITEGPNLNPPVNEKSVAEIRSQMEHMKPPGYQNVNEVAEAAGKAMDSVVEDYTRSLPTRLQPSPSHSPCPYCTKPIPVRPGPWAAHFAKYHKDQERPPAPNI